METKKFTLNIPIDLHEELRTMAFFEKKTMTEIILKEVRKVLKDYKQTKK